MNYIEQKYNTHWHTSSRLRPADETYENNHRWRFNALLISIKGSTLSSPNIAQGEETQAIVVLRFVNILKDFCVFHTESSTLSFSGFINLVAENLCLKILTCLSKSEIRLGFSNQESFRFMKAGLKVKGFYGHVYLSGLARLDASASA